MTVFTLALAPAALLTQQRTVILSTTTSTQDSGLLEPLRLSNFPLEANAQISQPFDPQIPISN